MPLKVGVPLLFERNGPIQKTEPLVLIRLLSMVDHEHLNPIRFRL